MCYYISITPRMTDIEQRFSAIFKQTESFKPVYSASAFTYPEIPVVSNEDKEHIQNYRWGLVPFWVNDIRTANTIRQRTLNARAETILEKPSFRHSIRSKRCIVIADGFFEWRHEDKKKYPYYIRLTDHAPFAIAGIWDSWVNPETTETIKTFSVITTRANSLLEEIHNTRKRMPIILRKEDESNWLKESLDTDAIQTLLAPYDSHEMEAYTVPNTVNRLGFNVTNPEVLKEYRYSDLPDLQFKKPRP